MGVTQYIGARYVPLFADPAQWNNTRTYEPLTIVLHEGNSFTSKQFVPVGIDINNESFWAQTGNYNSQVEQYRQEVQEFDERITGNSQLINEYEEELAQEIEDRIEADNKIDSAIDSVAARQGFIGYVQPDYIGRFCHLYKYVGQGGCLISNDLILRYAQDTENKNFGIVEVASLSTKAVSRRANNVKWGHANAICFDGKYLYVAPMSDYTANVQVPWIYKVNLENLETINQYNLPFNVYSVSYDKITKKYYCNGNVNGNHNVYEWNPETNEVEFVFTIPFQQGKKPRYQGVIVHDNIFYVPYFDPNFIQSYDIEGNLIMTTALGETIGYMDAQEVETITIADDGTCYVLSNGYYHNCTYKYEFVGAIRLKKGNVYTIQDDIDAYAYPVKSICNPALNPLTNFYADGSTDAPFSTIAEGLMHFCNNPFSNAINLMPGTFNESVRYAKAGPNLVMQSNDTNNRCTINGSIIMPFMCDASFSYINFKNTNDYVVRKFLDGTLYFRDCTFSTGTSNAIESHGNVHFRTGVSYTGTGNLVQMTTPGAVFAQSNWDISINWVAGSSAIFLPTKTIQ